MAYLTDAEFQKRLKPDLINRSDLTQRGDAIDAASSMIDGYLEAGGYAVPVTSPPDLLLKYCADIARYEIANYIGLTGQMPRESVYYIDYENALKWLRDVQKGRLTIPGLAPEGAADGSPARPIVNSNARRGWGYLDEN